MGKRGPEPTSAQELYVFAQDFYWDFRSLAEGYSHWGFDRRRYQEVKQELGREGFQLSDEDRAKFERKEEEIQTARLSVAEKEERLRRLQRDQLWDVQQRRLDLAQEASRKQFKVPGKPD